MKTITPKIKAQAHGLKFDGVLVKCYVSYGTMRNGSKEFTIYANDYGVRLPRVNGWENDTDSMTDYFDKDKIRVSRQSPFYREWIGELRRKRNIDRARFRAQQDKRQAKWAARRGQTFTPKNPFTKWLENHLHYKGLIEAKAAREAAKNQDPEHTAFVEFVKEEQAKHAAQVYKANQPPALTVLPRPARCVPAVWSVARVLPVCRPAAWSFDRVAGF